MVTGVQWLTVAAAIVTILGGVSIISVTVLKIARLRASREESPTFETSARLEAVEGAMEGLQKELTEVQERLDFAERLLKEAHAERRIGS
jgi:hypothetical protein